MGGWWVKSDFSVSLCPFSSTFGHTDTEMDTELDNRVYLERFTRCMKPHFTCFMRNEDLFIFHLVFRSLCVEKYFRVEKYFCLVITL